MIAARLLLMLNSLVFGVFGLLFLIWPAGMAATVGLAAANPTGIIDIRATYGGLELGISALLGYCAISIGGTAFGLLAATCAFTGFAGGRLIGIIANGGAVGLIWGILACDVLLVALNAWMLRQMQGRD
ncbi:MAG: DUF4345 family protein [Candidatus Sericytochromatia bacterium]|nr:DUF4345 family protein [Candidatus Sericytochromatia bacterium]